MLHPYRIASAALGSACCIALIAGSATAVELAGEPQLGNGQSASAPTVQSADVRRDDAGLAELRSVASDEVAVPGRYIISLAPNAAESRSEQDSSLRRAESLGAQEMTPLRTVNGYAATLSPEALAAVRQDPNVALVEPVIEVSLAATQTNPPWGLDRIDQRQLPLNNSYTYNATGSGVHAYIVDSGIRETHDEFRGRIGTGFDATGGGSTYDCLGHGSHVAGITGGSTYGVAKGVTLHAVRVFGCGNSTTSDKIVAGIDWVTQNATKPAVANMSLRGGKTEAQTRALKALVSSGVTLVAAAGNDSRDACDYSPGFLPEAITVAATNKSDEFDYYTNYGSCVDIIAPGSDILSVGTSSDTASTVKSGTSMAAPHVAGAVALYLQGNRSASPASVTSALLRQGTSGVVKDLRGGSDLKGTPNLLLNTYAGASGPGNGNGTTPTPVPTTTRPTTPGPVTGNGRCGKEITGVATRRDYFDTASFQLNSGTIKACLDGPAGTDFDLQLQRNDRGSWVTVAKASTLSSTEELSYYASAGEYRFRIWAYKGTGTYRISYTAR